MMHAKHRAIVFIALLFCHESFASVANSFCNVRAQILSVQTQPNKILYKVTILEAGGQTSCGIKKNDTLENVELSAFVFKKGDKFSAKASHWDAMGPNGVVGGIEWKDLKR